MSQFCVAIRLAGRRFGPRARMNWKSGDSRKDSAAILSRVGQRRTSGRAAFRLKPHHCRESPNPFATFARGMSMIAYRAMARMLSDCQPMRSNAGSKLPLDE
jgi:hypothetical protein